MAHQVRLQILPIVFVQIRQHKAAEYLCMNDICFRYPGVGKNTQTPVFFATEEPMKNGYKTDDIGMPVYEGNIANQVGPSVRQQFLYTLKCVKPHIPCPRDRYDRSILQNSLEIRML